MLMLTPPNKTTGEAMRKFWIAAAVAALAVAPALAEAATQAPLAAGQPSGVHKAQLLEGNTGLFVVGAAVIGVAIAAATNQGGGQTIGVQGVTATATST